MDEPSAISHDACRCLRACDNGASFIDLLRKGLSKPSVHLEEIPLPPLLSEDLGEAIRSAFLSDVFLSGRAAISVSLPGMEDGP